MNNIRIVECGACFIRLQLTDEMPGQARSQRSNLVERLLQVVFAKGSLTGMRWRSWLPGAESSESLFGGVQAAVYSFMSHTL
mgnify:CR=1 FL=1